MGLRLVDKETWGFKTIKTPQLPIEKKIFGMAASDFVAPRLTGEKKDSGPPGLLGLKTLSLVKSTNYTFREQLISKGEVR